MSPRNRPPASPVDGAARTGAPATIAKGVGSVLALVLVIGGTPWVLTRIGAFPTSAPDPAALWQEAIGPDLTGRGAFTVMAALVWIGWATFTLSVLREAGAALRSRGRRPARPLRGLTLPGHPAAILVTAIVAMFVVAPLLTATAPEATAAGPDSTNSPNSSSVTAAALTPGDASPSVKTSAAVTTPAPSRTTTGASDVASRPTDPRAAPPTHHASTTGVTTTPAPAGRTRYTVRRHDTLWSIADRQLGDPLRYQEIAALNPDVGTDFVVHPDQVLTLPTNARERVASPTAKPVGPVRVVTVVKGDTLSEIAAEHQVGDWHPVWDANKGRAEPGGKRFTDPNHIEANWTITLPGITGTTPTSTTPTRTNSRPTSRLTAATAPAPATPVPVGSPPAPAPATSSVGPEATTSGAITSGAGTSGSAGPGVAPVDTPAPEHRGPVPDQTALGPQPSAQEAAGGASAGVIVATIGRVAAGGAVLAAAVCGLLTMVRRQQVRDRRPGRTIAALPPDLAPIERAVVAAAAPAAADIARLDQVLRRVAATDIGTLHVASVQLTAGDITLHLATSAVLPTPWRHDDGGPGDGEGRVWTFPAGTPAGDAGADPAGVDALAPYPTLVNIGADATSSWLLNLEQTGALVLTGDRDRCLRLARVIAAQLGMNPWGEAANVTLLGFGHELIDAAPGRLRHATPEEATGVLLSAVAEAARTADAADHHQVAVVEGRRRAVADEAWAPQVLLVTSSAAREDVDPDRLQDREGGCWGPAPLAQLIELVHTRDGTTATAVVVIDDIQDGLDAPDARHAHDAPDTPGYGSATCADGSTVARLNADGMLTLSRLGLTVVANGWDEDTSRGVAMMLAYARTAPDEEVPDATGAQPWQAFADAAGALRTELVHPRVTPNVHDSSRPSGVCTLPLADEVYLQAGATTEADLAILAPMVPTNVREKVEQADPGLDQDVAAWFDPTNQRAKLTVLGPIALHTVRRAASRPAYWAELTAYLAYRPRGASCDEIGTAFSLAPGSTRAYLTKLRLLLGTNPDTGQVYLPAADAGTAKKVRGVNIYQLDGVLIDAELFRRLRLRGQGRGEAGIQDYITALRLVTGAPFSQMRDAGGAWLIGGDRIDQHLSVAIVDVAHLVTTATLAAGDTVTARAAADIARLAAPDAEGPRLDTAAIDNAEGRTDKARRTLLDEVCNRSDDGQPPMELSPRTQQILARHRDWLSRAS